MDSEFPTYTINSVNDFLKVPEDRIEDCLAEFAESIKTFRATVEILRLTVESFGFPPEVGDIIAKMPEFTWIDDGRRNQTVHLIEHKGE